MPFKYTLTDKPSVGDVRSQLLAAADYLSGIRTKRDAGEDFDPTDARSAIDAIHELDALFTVYERQTGGSLNLGGNLMLPGNPAALGVIDHSEGRTAGQVVIGHDLYKTGVRSKIFGASHVEVPIDHSMLAGFRALIDTANDDAAGDAYDYVPKASTAIPPIERRRRMFLRNLLNVQGTGLASIPYIKEVSAVAYEGGASAVAEAGLKPEVDMAWALEDAPVRKIAAWVPMTTEAIEDTTTLMGYVDTRLMYLLAVREEFELLSGDGNAPHVKGLLNHSGVQTQSAGADVPATIGAAFGLVENVDGEVDGVVMNPIKFWSMIVTRHANQLDGVGSLGLPYAAPPQGVFGLPVVRTRALASSKALVGSFRIGATLFDRAQGSIKVGNQHSDYFIYNKVVVLAEERVALAVHRPDFFVDVTLP